jgi:hypothetical protein
VFPWPLSTSQCNSTEVAAYCYSFVSLHALPTIVEPKSEGWRTECPRLLCSPVDPHIHSCDLSLNSKRHCILYQLPWHLLLVSDSSSLTLFIVSTLHVKRQFVLAEATEDSREPTAQEAAKLASLSGLISVCIGIMHSWCMPSTRSCKHPNDAKYEFNCVKADMLRHHSRWHKCAWAAPILLSESVPSNAYICSRLLARQAAEYDPNEPGFWKVRPCSNPARCLHIAAATLHGRSREQSICHFDSVPFNVLVIQISRDCFTFFLANFLRTPQQVSVHATSYQHRTTETV